MIEFIEHGPVCEIRMSHPPVNALSGDFMDALTNALVEKTANYRALVVSGQPGMFSAGLDIVSLSNYNHEQVEKFWRQFFKLLETVGASPVPIAMAITGHSPAGGAVMAIHADYRVMTQGNYKIGLNEVQVGLVVPPLVQNVLIRLVGKYRAERLMVAGALISPQEALGYGMVDEVADSPEDAVARAVEWCTRHASLPAQAMSQTRKIVRQDLIHNYDDLTQADIDQFTQVWFSDETQTVIRQVIASLGNKKG